MALQASGQITHSDIMIELGNSGSAMSNSRTMAASATPAKTAPDGIEEWYSYDDNPVADAPTFFIAEVASDCGQNDMDWTDGSTSGALYRIEVNINSAGWNLVLNAGTIASGTQFFSDTDSPGDESDTVQYRIRAAKAGYDDSNWVNGNPLIIGACE